MSRCSAQNSWDIISFYFFLQIAQQKLVDDSLKIFLAWFHPAVTLPAIWHFVVSRKSFFLLFNFFFSSKLSSENNLHLAVFSKIFLLTLLKPLFALDNGFLWDLVFQKSILETYPTILPLRPLWKVVDAFVKEKFTWGTQVLHSLREFVWIYVGWICETSI